MDTTFTFKLDGKRRTVDVKNGEQTVVQQIVLAPGGHTGWHSHPGPVVVVVQAGELIVTQGNNRTCTGVTYTAGQAFMDPGQGKRAHGEQPG